MSTASRIAALRAMADQDVSPNEAEIARAKLAAMGAGDREPPRRPPAAPAPGWQWDESSTINVRFSGGASSASAFVWFTTTGTAGTNL